MFDVYCDGHGSKTILSTRSIVGIDQRDGVITLHLRCWCGQRISHATGRNHTTEPSLPERSISLVDTVASADVGEAARHFGGRLAVETDPSDVWSDLQSGSARFVLLDARSREAFDEAHLPGAVSAPHAELTAEWARDLMVERDAELLVTYCWRTSCNAATKAAARLAAFGLPVKEMIGGIEGWQAEGLPVERAAVSA
jgi:rhodanese-related sulfurtransferase